MNGPPPTTLLGAAFPFRIDPLTGGVAVAVDREKVRQNLRIIIGTRYGERPLNRTFGTKIHSLAHEPNDDVLEDLIGNQIREAVAQWEPRILVTESTVERRDAQVFVRLRYVFVNQSTSDELLFQLA